MGYRVTLRWRRDVVQQEPCTVDFGCQLPACGLLKDPVDQMTKIVLRNVFWPAAEPKRAIARTKQLHEVPAARKVVHVKKGELVVVTLKRDNTCMQ